MNYFKKYHYNPAFSGNPHNLLTGMWKTMWIVGTKVPNYQGIVSNCTKKKRTYSGRVFDAPWGGAAGGQGVVPDFQLAWVELSRYI
jgi:hypothetical protein